MSLNSGLFSDQDKNEQDLGAGGWTIDDQKPSFWDNVTGSPFRGLGQAAADGISVLAHGVNQPFEAIQRVGHIMDPMRAYGPMPQTKQPWEPDPDAIEQAAQSARNYSKSLIPDPRVTGTGANLVQGVVKSLGEFGAGFAAGGPVGGAALLGSAEGYAHYQDLRDQGVDEDTATRSGLLTGALNAGGAFLPMHVPASWVAGLSTAGTYAAQAGAGAAINTAFGLASRYGSAKILDDAGYHQMAEQAAPWDKTNMAADAISGLFFGATAAWHGMKAKDIDPSLRDGAKVVQDRQEVIDRAPGVPVDMKSAATHRAALETALDDLMHDKPVDLDPKEMDGATFARPEENTVEAREIMRKAFTDSGVLEDASEFDKWLAGERETRPEVSPPKPAEPVEAGIPKELQPETEETKVATEPALASRPDLEITKDTGEPIKAVDALEQAKADEAQGNSEADKIHQAMIDCEARHL